MAAKSARGYRCTQMEGRGRLDLVCEASMNNQLLSFLSEFGHNVYTKTSNDAFGFGGAQLIRRLKNGFYIGGSESRKDGHVVGF